MRNHAKRKEQTGSESPRLTYRDRFRMAWELTWPLAVVDTVVILVLHGLLDTSGETLVSIWAVVMFFVVSPWALRRALQRSYSGVRVAVARQPGARRESEGWRLSYQESLKVMWLLAWRWIPLALASILVISLALKAVGGSTRTLQTPGPLANNLGLSAVEDITDLLFLPILIPGMLRKRYRGFSLVLEPRSRK